MTPSSAKHGALARFLLAGSVLTWLAAFTATHLPRGKVPEVHVSDKMLHCVGYFVLGSLFLWTLGARGVDRARRVGIVFVALATYGALDEITQPLVRRHASATDWLADLVGVAAALALWEAVAAIWKWRTHPAKPDG